MKKISVAAIIITLFTLISCQTTGGKGTADDKAIANGITAWNEKSPEAAKAFWVEIKDPVSNKKYLGFLDSYNNGVKFISDASTLKTSDEAKLSVACEKSIQMLSSLDAALTLPAETKKSGMTLAEGRVRFLFASGKITAARDLSTRAVKVFGESETLAAMNKESDVILASRSRQADAETAAKKIENSASFDEKILDYDSAVTAYSKAESALAADAAKVGVSKNANVVAEALQLKKQRQALNVEREKILREQAYLYKDRIGEEFARTPDKGTSGNITMEELLKHEESVKANIESIYQEMVVFAARYPDTIGNDILTDISDQKKDLDAKIAQVTVEIRTAKEIASRGKVATPVMIGLFNPAPGTAAEGKKSRPAEFSATNAKKAEYWWGMVSIPAKEMNDLVITLKDNRAVRVFPENTKNGSLIKSNKLVDLVNRGYKVGNSWPVLNAGSQLTSDKYFFEIQPGKTNDYEGEVVVYSSFIVRMR